MQAVNSLTITILGWSLSRWRPSLPRRSTGVLSLLRFGGHLTAYNLVTFMSTNLDSVLIGRLCGSVELGLYDRALKLTAIPLWQISLPVARVADSLLARLRGSEDRYRRAYLQMLEVLLLVTVPAVVCVAMSADTLVPLLLGRNWAPASPIVAWLAVATAFAPLSISSYWLFVSQGRAAEQLRYVCVKTALSVTALLAGLPWGAAGVARSYALLALFTNGSLLWGATRTGPVNLRSVGQACLPFILAAAATAVVMDVSAVRLSQAGLPPMQRMVFNVLICYGTFAAALLCHPSGQKMIHRIWILRSSFGRAAVVP